MRRHYVQKVARYLGVLTAVTVVLTIALAVSGSPLTVLRPVIFASAITGLFAFVSWMLAREMRR